MALKLRKDGQGYKVFSGNWALGRIREQRDLSLAGFGLWTAS